MRPYLTGLAATFALLCASAAQAETSPPPSSEAPSTSGAEATSASAAEATSASGTEAPPSNEQLLEELRQSRQELKDGLERIQGQVDTIDERIDALEDENEQEEEVYEPGPGIVLARGRLGEATLGVRGYFRYLNDMGLDPTFTDAFGRTKELDLRQDFQLNRLQILTRGWLFDPRLRWTFYVWTQNVSMGDEQQVVVGGNMTYAFDEALNVQVGIFSIPSTRSTTQSFPNWLRIDHRTMADEYFRGSYSEGILAFGTITRGVSYAASLTNNLSILGVSATELDNDLSTVSLALWWMPTTGEYGPAAGFGDYEHHERLASLVGIRFTHSREDAQGQPSVNDFENAQLRLSDGTLLFSPDPFGTGGSLQDARYQMLALDGGLKYRGWSLDGEYYFRWLDEFGLAQGTIPVTDLYDHGFQLQASTMLQRERLQAYVSGSQIYGQFGDPWDVAAGLTYFPMGSKEVRLNVQGLYTERSAVGYTAIPYQVGGTGWTFTIDFGIWF